MSTQILYQEELSLATLVKHIRERLETAVSNETIQLCGTAPLSILSSNPDKVLQLATQKLHTWPFQQVPTHWRRLFEDASLHIAVSLLLNREVQLRSLEKTNGIKRRKVTAEEPNDDWIGEVVQVLDRAVIMSGAPGRKDLIDAIFHQLDYTVQDTFKRITPQPLDIAPPQKLDTRHEITRSSNVLSFEEFQLHLHSSTTPLIITGSFDHWPARKKWSDVTCLKQRTLGGNRLVPVEIGTSYNEEDWTQKIMTMSQFIDEFLVPSNPDKIGYLAQHDLFAQVPSLKTNISTPDYCFTTPPRPTGAALQTPGLADTQVLDETLINAWLGPKGTKTPLHTDPYHNILCQVVGYKYVRLYPPTETAKLYPDGTNESGINMSNTSTVDVQKFRRLGGGNDEDTATGMEELREKFPLFEDAVYEEAILAPGECLYIPLGCWHYVESLTASFSVSFWWNA